MNARLIVADSERDANMLYAVGMFVPDPFIFLRIRGRSYVAMSDLEIDRARGQASGCHVLSLGQIQRRLQREGVKQPGLALVIRRLSIGQYNYQEFSFFDRAQIVV